MNTTHRFQAAKDRILAGRNLEGALLERFVTDVAHAQGQELAELLRAAHHLRMAFMGNKVDLCAIVNAKSGRCSENCAFCAQSAHYTTDAPVYPYLDIPEILHAAHGAFRLGVMRLGIVTSGKSLDGADFDKLRQTVSEVSQTGLLADVSCGLLEADQFKALKKAGLSAYHHNLETARSFFPQVCTTHAYHEDVRAVSLAVSQGLYVCSGGVFGLGESWAQRAELALTLRELAVPSVPVNFLTPIPGTPMADRPVLDREEALKIVALLRFLLPERHIRICGGRQAVFGDDSALAPVESGASALMIGDYLTTKGVDAMRDISSLTKGGWLSSGGGHVP